jgi:hypothetical protein
MLLTGFDSKYLNTLYVDKNLKYHGLIQAFSRTNRVLNDSKPYGNILDFRQSARRRGRSHRPRASRASAPAKFSGREAVTGWASRPAKSGWWNNQPRHFCRTYRPGKTKPACSGGINSSPEKQCSSPPASASP